MTDITFVAPAKAGPHVSLNQGRLRRLARRWAPACAGATGMLVGSAAEAEPVSLCGLTAPNVAGYHDAVVADPRFKRDVSDPLRETFTAESIQKIWVFTTSKNSIYPTALCEEVVDGVTMRIERHSICEADAAGCAKFADGIADRDDSSGDGE